MRKKRVAHYIEELILVALIILNVLDFVESLPADLDYVKKIISWTALGYLFYHGSLTSIFFNNRHRWLDAALLLVYFSFILKNIILFSDNILEEFVIFHDLLDFLVNTPSLQVYSLIFGSVALMALAVYSACFVPIRKPSLMHTIHEEGLANTPRKFFERVLVIYLVYMAFFIVVFNLVMEWLTIAIDSPLIMIAILSYIILVIRHRHRYNVEHIIFKIGKFGETFYEKFITLFHYKKTILLGISGMLVLHLVTDALSFIVPFIVTFKDALYFTALGPGHEPLALVFLDQSATLPIAEQASLLIVYVLNVLGILSLLLLPALYWFTAFHGKKITLAHWHVSLIFISILTLFFSPIFGLAQLTSDVIVGVDITTQPATPAVPIDFTWIFLAATFVFVVVMFLSINFKRYLIHAVMIKSALFFSYYIYLYFISVFLYFINLIKTLFALEQFFLTAHFLIFFAISILFYVVGFIMFIDEIIKEKVYIKIS